MAKQTIGEFLATMRKSKGYTQQQVADILGVSNRTVSVWETNKAYPDILTLPALAELYGVTADEILKGERNCAEPAPVESDLSEKAQNSLYKGKLARASAKNAVLTGAGLGGALLFVLTAFLLGWMEPWTAILLFVLVAADLVAVATLAVVFDRVSLSSAGVYTEEELSPAQIRFIASLRKKEEVMLAIVGAGLLLCAAAISLLIITGNGDIFSPLMFYFSLACGIAFLAAAVLLRNHEIKARACERRRAVYLFNRKLFCICSGCALAVCAACVALICVFQNKIFSVSKNLYTAPRGEFVRYFHTVVIGETLASQLDIAAGEYALDIPPAESVASGEWCDLGNGFYAQISRALCVVRYFSGEEGISVAFGNAVPVEGGSEVVYDIRGEFNVNFPDFSYYGGFLGKTYYLTGYSITVDGDIYTLVEYGDENYGNIVTPVCVTAIAASAAAATIVYFVKQKRAR